MLTMEEHDPWNLKSDPWDISKIEGHCNTPYKTGCKDLLIVYRCNNAEEWIPCENVVDDEPWLVSQYIDSQGPNFKQRGEKQCIWGQKYIRNISV